MRSNVEPVATACVLTWAVRSTLCGVDSEHSMLGYLCRTKAAVEAFSVCRARWPMLVSEVRPVVMSRGGAGTVGKTGKEHAR